MASLTVALKGLSLQSIKDDFVFILFQDSFSSYSCLYERTAFYPGHYNINKHPLEIVLDDKFSYHHFTNL